MKIPIVDENDTVIGKEERSIIHAKGLKHREIHVWLVTPEQEFIFQKRGPSQDTWPNFYDVTVGGHVDNDFESYQEAAERELFEETGVKVPIQFITKLYSESYDPNTNTQNNAFRVTFAGLLHDGVDSLKVEDLAGQGFVKFSLDELSGILEEEKKKFIPRFLGEDYMKIFLKIIQTLFPKQNATQS